MKERAKWIIMQQKNKENKHAEPLFCLRMQERKQLLNSIKDKFVCAPLIDAVTYWRDHERSHYQLHFKEEIGEMLKHGIFPETLNNDQQFTIEAFKYIRHLDVLAYIKQQRDWGEQQKKQITLCYRMFIN